jgi:hypothetical protein
MAKFNLSPLLDSLAAAPAADLATSRWQGEMEAHAAALAMREEAVARDEQQPADKLRVSKNEASQPQQAATEPALDSLALQKQPAMHAPQSLAEAEALQQPQQPVKEALQQLQQASEALQQPQQQAKEAADEESEVQTQKEPAMHASTLQISQDLKRALFNKMSAQVHSHIARACRYTGIYTKCARRYSTDLQVYIHKICAQVY